MRRHPALPAQPARPERQNPRDATFVTFGNRTRWLRVHAEGADL